MYKLVLSTVLFCFVNGSFVSLSSLGLKASSKCDRDTKWEPGSGLPIKEWIEGIKRVSASDARAKNNLHVVYNKEPMEVISYVGPSSPMTSKSPAWAMFGPYPRYDGWVYGRIIDREGVLTSKTHRTYIYPDFKTAIVGEFQSLKLVKGNSAKITHFRCRHGIMEIKTNLTSSGFPFKEENSRATFIVSDLRQMDPLERTNVYIGTFTFLMDLK